MISLRDDPKARIMPDAELLGYVAAFQLASFLYACWIIVNVMATLIARN